jgi:hypothetical protein
MDALKFNSVPFEIDRDTPADTIDIYFIKNGARFPIGRNVTEEQKTIITHIKRLKCKFIHADEVEDL